MNTRAQHGASRAGTAPFDAVHHRFERLALTYPGAVAVRGGAGMLTYGELDCQADALAAHLQRRGLLPGQFCALHLPTSCALVRAMLAVLKAGGAFVLLDPALPPARIAALTHFFDPALLLTQGHCPAGTRHGTLVLQCAGDDAGLPCAWPDEHPVRAHEMACALPSRQPELGVGVAMLTHADLHALCDTPAGPPAPPGTAALAVLWGPLTHGAPVTLAS
ncbi:AMP-binding enzyme [Pseudoduganella lurida]|uniref:AMP-binding enzyme n=1 Tax=Pseudoduganella lurida TaxID=1036180 RepID=A0A562R0S8_9BURK|nr:AMP-binding protein [Pseudoduganella lurida]TWI62184.1 AMP-binding enzyme [Pseudoduganella lurida]